MFASLKFVPRDKVEQLAEEEISHDHRPPSKKRRHKEKHGDKDKDKHRGKITSKSRDRKKRFRLSDSEDSSSSADSDTEAKAAALQLKEDAKTGRKDAGMEWMLRAPERPSGVPTPAKEGHETATLDSENPKPHVRELNPNIVTGEEDGHQQVPKTTSPLVGDGSASWRLKALRRAQEQAPREGRDLNEVVQERWDSVGTLTSSVAVKRSAHANAHMHAIRDRKYHKEGDLDAGGDRQGEYSSRMQVPHVESSRSWKSRKKYESQAVRPANASIITAAARSMNKYAGYGSFLKSFETDFEARKITTPVGEKESLQSLEVSTIDSFEVVYEPAKTHQTG